MLSVAYETPMFKFMVAVRSQAIKLIFHLEHMQKSVVRPHLFTNLRLTMMGRDENRGMAFVWPSFFMNVKAADSDFALVYEEFKAEGLLAVTMGGMAAFSVPTVKKTGTSASGAGDVAHDDDGDETDARAGGGGAMAVTVA